jgi:TM2 domain-containing membrane protein YozV
MNCVNHPEAPVAAFCRTCGKALCATCQRPLQGTVFCDEHLPATPPPPAASAAPAAPIQGASPGLAFLLGLVPGVGAIYNGQYAKGLVHVVVFGMLVSITSSGSAGQWEPLFGISIAAWIFYMAFEAYHTASRRQQGLAVDEFSSLISMHRRSGFPAGPLVLIALGVVFLLNTLDILSFDRIIRYWPVFLIVLGLYMLYLRIAGPSASDGREASHERQ